MSIGLQLLSSVIASGSRSAVREMQAEFFLPEELPFYEYFTGFYRRHGVLPTTQVMAEGGYHLPPAGSPFAYYVERIRDRSIYQVAMEHYPRLGEALSRRDMAAAIERARTIAQAGNRFRATTDVIAIRDAFDLVWEDYERAYQDRLAGTALRGVTMGWDAIDAVTMGAQGGDVVTLAARPNVGKSWLMLYFAERAWVAGHPCLFVTMEMELLQTARRFLSLSSGVNPDYLRRGDLSRFGEGIVYEAIERTADRPPFHFVAGNLRKSVGAVDAILQEFEPDAIY